MPTPTTYFQLQKPLVNDPTDQDQWGTELNADLDQIDGLLKVARDTVTTVITSTTALTSANRNQLMLADATAATFMVTMPSPAAVGAGFRVIIKKTDATVNVITIAPFGAETFDGAAGLTISGQYNYFELTTDGFNWSIISGIPKATSAQVIAGTDDAAYMTVARTVQAIGLQLSPWVAYTPVFVGLGTVSNVSFFSRQVGDTLQVMGKVTSGSSTATPVTISLGFNGVNGGITVNAAKIPTGYNNVGTMARSTGTSNTSYNVIAQGGDGTVEISNNFNTGGLTPSNGNNTVAAGSTMSVEFQVPVW